MILSCLTANHFSDIQRVVNLQGSNKHGGFLATEMLVSSIPSLLQYLSERRDHQA